MTEASHPAWGKHPDENHKLSLIDHSADVAAVVEALLQNTLMGRRLARLGGLDEMPEVWIARLGYLAALHDFGKAGVRFQKQKPGGGYQGVGHQSEALALLRTSRFHDTSRDFAEMLLPKILDWQPNCLWELLWATVCHHGRPREIGVFNRRDWEPNGKISPLATLGLLISEAESWFPEAFEKGPAFPESPEFQHSWNGVLNLADWLASNESFFPFYGHTLKEEIRMTWSRDQAEQLLEDLHLDVRKARTFLGSKAPDWRSFAPRDSAARPTQDLLAKLPLQEEGSLTILEASTGSGKTEAAVWHFARLFQARLVDGMTFALPTRTAATQIETRLTKAMKRFIRDDSVRPQVVLAVPGYLRVDGIEGRRGEGFHVQWDDDNPTFRRRGWAAEHSKRFLAGAVVVGTVDQVLLSALQVPHTHLRAACLLRHLLVVDEVHASDEYMGRVLEQVLEHHQAAGGHALLMSATLGAGARHRFLYGDRDLPSLAAAEAMPYPLICHRGVPGSDVSQRTIVPGDFPKDKVVQIDRVRLMSDPEAIVQRALEAAQDGARVLVVRNTVDGCRQVQAALVELAEKQNRLGLLFGVRHSDGHHVSCPHHGRFAPVDRRLLDVAIEAAFRPASDRRSGMVAVATQTVEQSLDLDADLLITDLCPMDVLLQRLGRLHRHRKTKRTERFRTPRAIILVPETRDLLKKINSKGSVQSPEHGLGGFVYPDLRIIDCTWKQLEEHVEFRLPSMARRLVERSTHPEALSATHAVDSRWQLHGNGETGSESAQRRIASLSVLEWNTSYGDVLFPDEGRFIPTRLGARDLLLKLPDEPMGPFGVPVPEIKIPAWFFGKVIPNELIEDPEVRSLELLDSGGFTLQIGKLTLHYGVLGLDQAPKP